MWTKWSEKALVQRHTFELINYTIKNLVYEACANVRRLKVSTNSDCDKTKSRNASRDKGCEVWLAISCFIGYFPFCDGADSRPAMFRLVAMLSSWLSVSVVDVVHEVFNQPEKKGRSSRASAVLLLNLGDFSHRLFLVYSLFPNTGLDMQTLAIQ